MTEAQAAELIALLELQHSESLAEIKRCVFLLVVVAFGVAWLSGSYFWRMVVLAKNQRHFW